MLLSCQNSTEPHEAPSAPDPCVGFAGVKLARGRTVARAVGGEILPVFDAKSPPGLQGLPPEAWGQLRLRPGVPFTLEGPPPRLVPAGQAWPGEYTAALTCGERVAELRFRYSPPSEQRSELADVVRLRESGDRSGARAALARAAADPETSPGDGSCAMDIPQLPISTIATASSERTGYASVELARSWQGSGEPDRVVAAWDAAAVHFRAARLEGEASRAARAAVYERLAQGKFEDARARLDAVAAADSALGDTAGAVRTAYYRGLLARYLGDLAGAEAILADAAERAAAAASGPEVVSARSLLALVRADRSDFAGARSAMAQARAGLDERLSAASRRAFELDEAWILLGAGLSPDATQAQRAADLRAAEAGLRAASARFEAAGEADRAGDARVNLAWLAFQRGDPPAVVEAELSRVPTGNMRAATRIFSALLSAELSLARGSKGALSAFRAAGDLARERLPGAVDDLRWRALFGASRARLARGDARGALADGREAVAALDAVSERTGARGDRALFLADRRALYALVGRLLIDEGSPGQLEEALRLADRVASATLRAFTRGAAVEALSGPDRERWANWRGEWAAGQAELESQAARSELLEGSDLARFRTEQVARADRLTRRFEEMRRWLDGHSVHSDSPGDDQFPGRSLVAGSVLLTWIPVGAGESRLLTVRPTGIAQAPTPNRPGLMVGDATHVYVLGPVPLGLGPIARWTLADGTELGRRVTFSELSSLSFLTGTLPGNKRSLGNAVLAGDAAGDLVHARKELDALARRRSAATSLVGPALTRAALLQALGGNRPALFHFAGHGVLRSDAPFESHLRLAGTDRLTLDDVLVHRPRAERVVLNACEAGATSKLSRAESIGLAEAFLVAGARSVLAPTSPIDDALAARLIERFYAAGGATAPAEAWRLVFIQPGDDLEKDAWLKFRLSGAP